MTRSTQAERHARESTRREIIGLMAAGAGMVAMHHGHWMTPSAFCGDVGDETPPPDTGSPKQQIVAEAYRLGYQYEQQYGGCAQCALAALQDAIPFLAADGGLFRGASCLDGGATPTGLQNCGAFTGSGMAIGYLCGRRRNGKFEGTTAQAHALVRKLYAQFDERYGSVLCKDVREKAQGDCPEVVGLAAQWTAQILMDEFGAQGTGKTDPPPDSPERPQPEHGDEQGS